MSALRKIQKVGYSTLMVSIPAAYAKELELSEGESIEVREEVDGTLRLIPALKGPRTTMASINAAAVQSEEMLSKTIEGCYMLGYDTIEVVLKGAKESYARAADVTIKRLRGMEIVESSEGSISAQSLMDPAKFPIDSLFRRLQSLASRSMDGAITALRREDAGVVEGARKIQGELDELYWLIVRQLLISLINREISAKIRLESPLHVSGDRTSAKMIEEIGRLMLDLVEETARLRESGARIDDKALVKMEALGAKAQQAFNSTIEALLSSDVRMIDMATKLIKETMELEKKTIGEPAAAEYGYSRTMISDLGQVARYCDIMIEIAVNRLLRKTSRICAIQSQ